MKQARQHYEACAARADVDGLMRTVRGLKSRELHALHHYALGREGGDTKDRILVCVLMECGTRYLEKQERKARRLKGIL